MLYDRGMNPLVGLALILLLATPMVLAQQAKTFEAAVTRKGNNVYHIDGKDLVVVTLGCNIQAYAENVLLTSNGTGGDITFLYSKDKCEVRGVYGPIPPKQGRFGVTVSLKADNWFEIFGSNTFLKTRACRTLVLAEESSLLIPPTGLGQLRFKDGTTCTVEAMYGKRKL